MQNGRCLICGELNKSSGWQQASGVSSDHRIVTAPKTIFQCESCCHIQVLQTEPWRLKTREIYEGYEAYRISGGQEQKLFDGTGTSMRRSSPLVEELLGTVGRGRRWLDYGAGDGTLLETVSVLDSSAQLNAFDVSDTREATIRGRCSLEGFSTEFDNLDGHYDVIILNHVLEHLEAPTLTLRSLAQLLSPCGILAVQVPDLSRNMFDICVFDHVSHFCERSLSNLLAQQHYAHSITTSLYHKELVGFIYGAELERSDTHAPASQNKADSPSLVSVSTRLDKASSRIESLKATCRQMGVFGTSIAGLWVGTSLGASLTHWVDEDPDRVGKTLWDRVIYGPESAPGEALVVLPFVPSIADGLLNRLVHGSNLVVVPV